MLNTPGEEASRVASSSLFEPGVVGTFRRNVRPAPQKGSIITAQGNAAQADALGNRHPASLLHFPLRPLSPIQASSLSPGKGGQNLSLEPCAQLEFQSPVFRTHFTADEEGGRQN